MEKEQPHLLDTGKVLEFLGGPVVQWGMIWSHLSVTPVTREAERLPQELYSTYPLRG